MRGAGGVCVQVGVWVPCTVNAASRSAIQQCLAPPCAMHPAGAQHTAHTRGVLAALPGSNLTDPHLAAVTPFGGGSVNCRA